MKYNKITAVCIAGVMAVSLTGCMDSVKNLSDEKSDMVAEYSAGLLLRHSDSYSKRLVTKADQTGNNSQEDVQTTATPAPVVSQTPVPPAASASLVPSESQTAESSPPVSGSAVDTTMPSVKLGDIYKKDGLQVTYGSYRFCRQYKSGSSQITVKSGNVLLVVDFRVKNTRRSKRKIELGNKKIDYTLNVDGNNYQPGISILENMGLNYLDTTLKSGGSEEAVLIFEMSKDKKKASQISLTVSRGGRQAVVQLR